MFVHLVRNNPYTPVCINMIYFSISYFFFLLGGGAVIGQHLRKVHQLVIRIVRQMDGS